MVPSSNSSSRLQRAWGAIASGGSALRHRNFRLFFFGQLISLVGTWMQTLAQSWLVYSLSHSPFQLGVVNTFQFAPILLVSLFAGIVVDRFPRRRVVIITQLSFLVLAVTLGVLVLSHQVQIWHVYLIAALSGTVNAFDIPARQAFMIEMVGKEDLLNGIALNSSIFNASRIFGPALAALLIARVDVGVCFLINAASYVAALIGLLMMDLAPVARSTMPHRQPLRQIGEGLSYIRNNERTWLVFVLVAVLNAFGVPMYVTLMPVFATQVLHADVSGLGTLSACVGLGALVGAILLAYIPPGPIRGRIMLSAAIVFSVSLAIFGLSPSLLVSSLLLVIIGYAIVSVNSAGNALVQEHLLDSLRGRVMSVWSLVLLGLGPVGSFIAGTIAEHFGAPLAVLLGGAICLVAAIAMNMRAWRHHVMVTLPEPAIVPLADIVPAE